MAVYLDGYMRDVYLNGISYHLNSYTEPPILDGVLLVSSEGYALTNSELIYLTSGESD